MEYREIIPLKDGRTCVIRNGVAEDGEAVLRNFVLNHAQTDRSEEHTSELQSRI